MHNYDDKYPARSGFEPGTPMLQALDDTNELSGPAGESARWADLSICLVVKSNNISARTIYLKF